MIDLMLDQLDDGNVHSVPTFLIYMPNDKDHPIALSRSSFESIQGSIEDQLGKARGEGHDL